MIGLPFIYVAEELDHIGLLWAPEIGDEVSHRSNLAQVSVLVDPQGMTPTELRETYLWLPTVEQMLSQIEARQGILFHAGLELSEGIFSYKTVVQSPIGKVESLGESLRLSVGVALKKLLVHETGGELH